MDGPIATSRNACRLYRARTNEPDSKENSAARSNLGRMAKERKQRTTADSNEAGSGLVRQCKRVWDAHSGQEKVEAVSFEAESP